MPVVAIIGAVIGDALIGTSLGMIGAVSVGSVIGAGVASGIYADATGGSFFNGFITGAATAGIGGLIGSAFGSAAEGLTGGTTAAQMAADQTAGFSYGDLADWGGTTAADWGGVANAANLGTGGMDNLGFGGSSSLGGELSASGGVDTFGLPDSGLGGYVGSELSPLDQAATLGNSSQNTLDSLFNQSGINNPYADTTGATQGLSDLSDTSSYGSPVSATGSSTTTPASLEGFTGASTSSPDVTSGLGMSGGTAMGSSALPTGSAGLTAPSASLGSRIQNGLSGLWDKAKSSPYQSMKMASGVMDMYSQNQLANQYAKQAQEYQNALNNPEIGFNNWMQGAGGDYLRQNAARMAKSGRTGAGPAMATQALQNWYSTGYPSYMGGLNNLYNMKSKSAAAKYSALTTPFQSFASALY